MDRLVEVESKIDNLFGRIKAEPPPAKPKAKKRPVVVTTTEESLPKKRKAAPVKPKEVSRLGGGLIRSINLNDVTSCSYLDDIFFRLLFGKVQFPIPQTWPSSYNNVCITSRKIPKRVKPENTVVIGSTFLNNDKKISHFMAFLLVLSKIKKIDVYALGGDFRHVPDNTMYSMLQMSCFITK
jgi:hypothetical protein